jgi:hypothetical protein
MEIQRLCENLKEEPSKENIERFSVIGNIIDEMVIYGAYLIDEIREQDPPVSNHNTRIMLMIIRDFLENIDSVSVLAKNGCGQGLMIVQRTVFEIYLLILYIFQGDFDENIVAYDVCHIKQRITAGRYCAKEKSPDEKQKISDTITELERKLSTGIYADLNERWEKFNTSRKYAPHWYQIISNNKKTSLRSIAKELNKLEMYNAFYGYYSRYAHGDLALLYYTCLDNDTFKIKKIRDPIMLNLICTQELGLVSDVYQKIVGKYLTDEHKRKIEEWYYEKRSQVKAIK